MPFIRNLVAKKLKAAIALRDLCLTQWRGMTIANLLGDASLSAPGDCLKSVSRTQNKDEIVLILIPCKNVARFLPKLEANLMALTYPARCIHIGFCEGDSSDNTYEDLQKLILKLEKKFSKVTLFKKDHHYRMNGKRWQVSKQRKRRSILAKVRNDLLRKCLKAQHSWVLWIDSDVIFWGGGGVIEKMLAFDKSILVPHCVNESGKTFDLNSFKYIQDKKYNWQSYIRDGLIQPPRGYGRKYLEDYEAYDLVSLDGVGATMLLVNANLHRQGLIFPEEPYHLHIETEGLAFQARKMGHQSWGTPRIRIIHPNY